MVVGLVQHDLNHYVLHYFELLQSLHYSRSNNHLDYHLFASVVALVKWNRNSCSGPGSSLSTLLSTLSFVIIILFPMDH